MKKNHKIVIGSIIFAMLSMFAALYQIQSEDDTTNEYIIYDMNHNWRCVSVSPVMEQLKEESEKSGENPDTEKNTQTLSEMRKRSEQAYPFLMKV